MLLLDVAGAILLDRGRTTMDSNERLMRITFTLVLYIARGHEAELGADGQHLVVRRIKKYDVAIAMAYILDRNYCCRSSK